jgi:hypothetical protein
MSQSIILKWLSYAIIERLAIELQLTNQLTYGELKLNIERSTIQTIVDGKRTYITELVCDRWRAATNGRTMRFVNHHCRCPTNFSSSIKGTLGLGVTGGQGENRNGPARSSKGMEDKN